MSLRLGVEHYVMILILLCVLSLTKWEQERAIKLQLQQKIQEIGSFSFTIKDHGPTIYVSPVHQWHQLLLSSVTIFFSLFKYKSFPHEKNVTKVSYEVNFNTKVKENPHFQQKWLVPLPPFIFLRTLNINIP